MVKAPSLLHCLFESILMSIPYLQHKCEVGLGWGVFLLASVGLWKLA
jgi:hypothetical protein